jgi:hypothetical protein
MDSPKFDILHAFEAIPDTKYTYVLSMFYKKGVNTKLYVRSDLRIFKYKIMKLESSVLNGFVQVKEIQKHPVNEKVIHIDFMLIEESSTSLRIPMPINFYNQEKSPGIKLGGFLKIMSRALEVHINKGQQLHPWLGVNMEGFQQNQLVKLSDIHFPEGIKPVRKELTVGIVTASKGGES